jgi:nucleoside-diphosphate kinase
VWLSFALILFFPATEEIEMERTYIMIKPDGVQRGLVGDIIKRFEQRGFQLLALKLVQPTQAMLEEHYQDLKGKGFFPGLIKYMSSGPVVAMVSICRRDFPPLT